MLVMIDNYDSFTYNIVQYLGELGAKVRILRNDETDIEEIERLHPTHICISPGPCSPEQAGISIEVIQHFAGKVPILGVCLGHQAIGAAFGGDIVRAKRVLHGKVDRLTNDGKGLFEDLPSEFNVVRYHSLAIDKETLPEDLVVTATTSDGEIMGVRHKTYPIEGLQFHPESISSEYGYEMLSNFLKMKVNS